MCSRSLARVRNLLACFLTSNPKTRKRVLVTLALKHYLRLLAGRRRLGRLGKEEHGRICTTAFDGDQMPAVVNRDLVLACRERGVSCYEAKGNVDLQICR